MGTTNESNLNSLFPFQDPVGWNLRIDDFLFVSNPGDPASVTVEIDGFEPESKFDEKESQGANGTSLTYQGYRLARGTIKIACWTDEGWQFLQLVLAKFRPPKGNAQPTAHDIFHPALVAVDVTRIFITKVSPPKWADQKLSTTLTCVEFAPPLKTAKSVTKTLKVGDIPDAYTGTGPVTKTFKRADGSTVTITEETVPVLPPSMDKPKP